MNLIPKRDYILITNDVESWAPGEYETQRVIAVGPGLPTQNGDMIPVSVQADDRVLFRSMEKEFVFDGPGNGVAMIRENAVMAIEGKTERTRWGTKNNDGTVTINKAAIVTKKDVGEEK